MIEMTKEDCTLCNGSGWVTPYPYRNRKKCDHMWNMGSFMDRLNDSRTKVREAEVENEKWEQAYETQHKPSKRIRRR